MHRTFEILDRDTGFALVTLPIGISISVAMKAYENMGYEVDWRWGQ